MRYKRLILFFWFLLLACSTDSFKKTVVLKNVKVNLVSDAFQFGDLMSRNNRYQGYATEDNEIWIICERKNDKYKCSSTILGHELLHLLHFNDLEVEAPYERKW